VTPWQIAVIALVGGCVGTLAGRATFEILYLFTSREKDYR
jgi:hypothetical protein